MKFFSDHKSWVIAFVESFGILLFNAAFVPGAYKLLGENVSTKGVVTVSAWLFIIRMLWFYLNLICRLKLEKRPEE